MWYMEQTEVWTTCSQTSSKKTSNGNALTRCHRHRKYIDITYITFYTIILSRKTFPQWYYYL